MSGFEPVVFGWNGQEYKIPAHKVLGAIARVEDIVTLAELQKYFEKGSMPLAKLSMAYGALLRYAGANASDGAIYESMFGVSSHQGRKSTEQEVDEVVKAILTLITMMVPPSAQRKKEKPPKGNGSPAATENTNLLKKPSKLRSKSGK